MADYTKVSPLKEGVAFTFANSAASTDYFRNTGKEILIVNNGGASPDNVTIKAANPCELGDLHDIVVAVTNGTMKIIGPFDPRRFNDSNGKVQIQHSYVTSVTVAVIDAP